MRRLGTEGDGHQAGEGLTSQSEKLALNPGQGGASEGF